MYIQIHDSKIRQHISGRLLTGNGYIFTRRRTFALALEDHPIAWVKRGIPRRVRGPILYVVNVDCLHSLTVEQG